MVTVGTQRDAARSARAGGQPGLPGLPGGQRGHPDRRRGLTLYPFVNIVARSFSDERVHPRRARSTCVPRGFNLTTYKLVMSDPMFWTNYRNTVVYTVVATPSRSC